MARFGYARTSPPSEPDADIRLGRRLDFVSVLRPARGGHCDRHRPDGRPPRPAGTVTVLEGSTQIGSEQLFDGQTEFDDFTFAVGTQTITAVYSGDQSIRRKQVRRRADQPDESGRFRTLWLQRRRSRLLGDVFIADSDHDRVVEVTGGVEKTYLSGLSDPTGLAVDSAGTCSSPTPATTAC